MELDLSHVLVTGASGALGGAVVRALLGRAIRVSAVASPGKMESCAKLGAEGGRLLLLEGNVASQAECERLCNQAEAALNPLDGVVACAGAWRGGRPMWDAPETELDAMMTANFRTAFFTLRAAARRMVARGRGRLVAVAAGAALQPDAGAGAYAVSKAAVVQTVRALAAELRGTGVT
ncbi:MAG TPA: SDR family oxidoreductase, partial [Myxococcota bacterium]|nr:SDR family oxidoreductase [Myxococcota bacterium]